jgi:hypothetical protein
MPAPVGLLIALSAELHESFSLNFDRLSMHMRCSEFLKTLHDDNEEYFAARSGRRTWTAANYSL